MNRVITYNLTDNFIQELADFIDEHFIKQGEDLSRPSFNASQDFNEGRDLSKLAIVFGGKRPSLFLKKELSRRIKRGFFSPTFFSIDEFIEYALSKKEPFSTIPDLDACFIIYKLARDIAPDILRERDSFSRFLPWAREIFNFIEQLDLEDITVDSLKNIQEKASIGYDVPEDINALLKSIISIRDAYHTVLKEKRNYSRGLQYLVSSQCIQDIDFSEFNQLLFCGFFYLHKTESNIIKTLYAAKKAILLFQGTDNEWSVLDKLSKVLSSAIQPQQVSKPHYNLSIQCGFDVHCEVGLVREIIKKINPVRSNPLKRDATVKIRTSNGTGKLDNTVIVLPEPNNIIPLLSEISSSVEELNVSLGYPLKRTSLYSLFECIFKAQASKKADEYYAKDYLKALAHPLVKNLMVLAMPALTRVLVHKIEEVIVGIEKTHLSGSLFFKLSDIQNLRELYDLSIITMKKMDIQTSFDELKEAVRQLHELLFLSWEKIQNFYDFSLSLQHFLDVLVEKSFLKNYPLNLKMAQKMFSIKEELKIASFNKEPFPREDIFKIFENKLENEMISFSGSPLKGLQILGLFETRTLNFENVIVMDVNESALPNLKVYEPLIPREVMISLGLNRLEKEEEIQRYHFKRLLSGSKNAHLIYLKREDKEKSRFIEELIWERQKGENALEVLRIAQGGFTVKVLPKRLEVKKNPQVLKFLTNYEYSASSLNSYLACPLKFYYQYVLGLREKEDLLEETETKDIGTFIHGLLNETFAKFIGKKPYIDERFEKEFFARLDKKFADEFEKKMKSDAFLVKDVLDFRLKRFLENERERDVRKVLCLEKTFKGNIQFKEGSFSRVAGSRFAGKFKAIIDRVDLLGDSSILVIDYKTGGTDIMPLADPEKIESAGFDRGVLKNTIKSFQLPLYLYFVSNNEKYKAKQINACLYSIKEIDKKTRGLNMLFKKEEQLVSKEKIMHTFLKGLDALLSDILNPEVPFQADEEDARQCNNCPFFYMCR